MPVSITYDRIFELCSHERLDNRYEATVFEMIANIKKTEPERLGDVTVKYLAPINIHEFLA